MKRNKKRALVALLAICALAAGGAAYTQTIDTSGAGDTTAAYGTVSVTGTNALSGVSYTFNNDGSQITGVTLTFSTALTGQDVQVGFDDQVTPSSGTLTDCGATTGTTATCTLSPAEDTTAANQLDILVQKS